MWRTLNAAEPISSMEAAAASMQDAPNHGGASDSGGRAGSSSNTNAHGDTCGSSSRDDAHGGGGNLDAQPSRRGDCAPPAAAAAIVSKLDRRLKKLEKQLQAECAAHEKAREGQRAALQAQRAALQKQLDAQRAELSAAYGKQLVPFVKHKNKFTGKKERTPRRENVLSKGRAAVAALEEELRGAKEDQCAALEREIAAVDKLSNMLGKEAREEEEKAVGTVLEELLAALEEEEEKEEKEEEGEEEKGSAAAAGEEVVGALVVAGPGGGKV